MIKLHALQSAKGKIWLILLVCFTIGIAIAGSILSYKYHILSTKPEEAQTLQTNILLKKVSNLVLLPQDSPTIAEITDISKLNQQTFFSRAENQDLLLIYTKDNITVLYRPSSNKVINIGSLNPPQAESSTSATLDAVVKIAIYNASGKTGAAEKLKLQLQKELSLPVFSVVTDNALKKDYSSSVVVIQNQNISTAIIQQLKESVDGEVVTTPPDGEKQTDADVLIILAQ